MLQAYSSNINMVANAAFPFNNVVVDKGCSEKFTGPSSVELNRRGVYLVEVDGFCTGSAAANNTVQLYVNGIARPEAISSYTTAAGDVSNFSFKTFVQVENNNCCCNCVSSPTVLQVLNGNTALTETHINIVVTQIR